jgi:hypothetical protein
MEEQDKIYLWLVVIAFLGLLVATGFGWAEILELRDQNIITTSATTSTATAPAAPREAPAAPAAGTTAGATTPK